MPIRSPARKRLLPRKGAPETFWTGGFLAALWRVAAGKAACLPAFDRAKEIYSAGVQDIGPDVTTLVVAGNDPFLADAPREDLAPSWDLSVFLDVPLPELKRRLPTRWAAFGYPPELARPKAEGNDIPDARRALAGWRAVGLLLRWAG